jgi:hypothetical protein
VEDTSLDVLSMLYSVLSNDGCYVPLANISLDGTSDDCEIMLEIDGKIWRITAEEVKE